MIEKRKGFKGLIYAVALLLLISCNDTPIALIPNVPVRVEVILTNIESRPLFTFPNVLYINNVGVRGIILRQPVPGIFEAFDRACSFRPLDSCERVSVHNSNLYLVDSCCRSQFDFEGNVRIGPAISGLRPYRVSLIAPNRILIVN